MPRGKKTSGEGHHGILAAVEAQYLAALKFSRAQIDSRIAALEGTIRDGAKSERTNTSKKGGASDGRKSGGKKSPRDYDMLKAKITKPMSMEQIVKAIGKQEGTVRQVMTNYPGLFKSDGKRPATYTLDSAR